VNGRSFRILTLVDDFTYADESQRLPAAALSAYAAVTPSPPAVPLGALGLRGWSRSMRRNSSDARLAAAAELYRLGVIEACVPQDQLLSAAMDIARSIAAKSPVGVRAVKRAFNTVEEMPIRDAYRYEQTITVDLSKTEDAREAQKAFVEKRKPNFTGR